MHSWNNPYPKLTEAMSLATMSGGNGLDGHTKEIKISHSIKNSVKKFFISIYNACIHDKGLLIFYNIMI